MASQTHFFNTHSLRMPRWAICLGMALPLVLGAVHATAQAPQANTKTSATSGNSAAKNSPEPVTLNFINAEIDAVAAQVANAGIMELEDAKKLSVKSLNGLLAKSGVVVANGAGGFVANSSYEPLPE